MRILFADALDPAAVEDLERLGHGCEVEPSLDGDSLPGRIAGFDVLVVRSTRVTAETIAAGPELRLVIRAGSGTNTIDVDAAGEAGVYVTNVPGRNSIAVAELTIGLLLAVDRRIPDNVADLRAGHWDKKTYSKADGLFGKTIAIVGLGDIGLEVAARASAFGLHVIGLRKPGRSPEVKDRIQAIGIELIESLDDLLARSDIVSLHVPASSETTGMVDDAFLSVMRPGAILINTARGDLVDEEAVLAAIENRGLRVGLDVYPNEPSSGRTEWVSELARNPHVVGTHHIGASTEQAQRAVAEGVVEIVDAFSRGEVLNCVNESSVLERSTS